MITLTQDGVEYTYVDQRSVKPDEWFITRSGDIRQYTGRDYYTSSLAIVKPVPVEHTFGGITFVETGEYGKVKAGEWYLSSNIYPSYWDQKPTALSYKILKPVRLV